MKKLKNLFIGLIVVLFCTGCSNANGDYDKVVLDNAAWVTSELGFNDNNPFSDGSRHFDVKKIENEFQVDVNGTQIIIREKDEDHEKIVPKNVKALSSKYDVLIKNSKRLIYQYIDDSLVLQNKEEIKKYIEEIEVKEATFEEALGYFSYDENCIYINRNEMYYLSEWTIVHELVHAISYYTHNCDINKEEYAFNYFNEVMTDIITSSVNPEEKAGQSVYLYGYPMVYPYINLVGQEAIQAYFYGYSTIYEKIDCDEFELFVIVLENYGEEYTDVCYNNLIFKWYEEIN